MGNIKIDLLKNKIKYESMFPLNTKKGLLSLLIMKNELTEKKFYDGDFEACVLLLDLEQTMKKANLTEKQKITLFLLYDKCYTQEEAAELLNTTQQSILDRRNKAIKRMLACISTEWI